MPSLGQAWASPMLAGLHCKMRVYVCLSMAIYWNLNWTNGYVHFKFTHAKSGSPHTSRTALQDACICLSVAIYWNLNWMNGYVYFKYKHAKSGSPHTSRTALQDACICLSMTVYQNLNWTNGYVHFEFAHMLKLARAQPVGIKNPGAKDIIIQVNTCMATADHDRQGQAAHRQYHQITHSKS